MKLIGQTFIDVDRESPPARGRGLKQGLVEAQSARKGVAPRAGAWIETRKAQY